jgi:hypothetical protein
MEERIPFNIKHRPEIEAGKYLVRTRDLWSAKIICWDKVDGHTGDSLIVALVEGAVSTSTVFYHTNGKYCDDMENGLDLFLVPNPNYKEPTTTCSTSVDWDAFRREAAKDFVAAHFANPNCNNLATDSIIKNCITAADELVWNLKKKKK